MSWPRKAIIYQIYPRSFNDANNDGFGDLIGIIHKLDYLQELGITALWLSPIYPSPMVDMGYDISNYKDIDPMFGTLEEFDQLLIEAHKRNIKIVMDFVPNHTSSQHPWFEESKQSINNSKRHFYIWKHPKPDGSPPNNWLSVFGRSAWELDTTTNQYYYHTFSKEQPDLNWRNEDVVSEMLQVLRFWLEKGVDGFRVDAAEWTYKDPHFLDEPPNPHYKAGIATSYQKLQHIYTNALPENTLLIKKFADVLEEYRDKFLVTEEWVPIEHLIKTYSIIGKDFYMPFNFGLISLPWRADVHKKYVDRFDKEVGSTYIPTYVLGNHDKSRIATRVGRQQARIAVMLQMTLRGIPFVYYGDEIGMQDVSVPQDKEQDILGRISPGMGRDPQRSPMQWNTQKFAGFSEVAPWLPLGDDYETTNVASETHETTSFLSLYKKLIHLRKTHPAFISGTYTSLDISSATIFAYTRELENEKFLVVLNYDDQKHVINLLQFQNRQIVCTTYMDRKTNDEFLNLLTLRPNEGIVFSIS